MKLKDSVCAAVLVLATAGVAHAQVQAGNLTGTITDQTGAVIPGVMVTLEGPGVARTFTSGVEGQYRFLNVPPGTYTLIAELPGFTTVVRENVVVVVGSNVDIPMVMRIAAIAETVTVSAASPVIDAKAIGTVVNFTQDELSRIPTSRDPWALLRTVPGVVIDRINIAGNETGQQSGFVSKGTRREDAVWTMDGINITDMAAVGASPTYFDYDAFDEIQVSTAGQDMRQPTGGVGINMIVKRGTNDFKGTARLYFTNDSLQWSNVPSDLAAVGVTPETADQNKQISDYGLDLGGPILRDRLFFWGSFTRQDIRLIRQSGNLVDRTDLVNDNIKVNWQASDRHNLSFLHFLGSKLKYGRATGAAELEPKSASWEQGNLYPDNPFKGLWKVEDNWVISPRLFATVKYAYYGTGFSLEPGGGLDGQAGISQRLGQSFGTTRAIRYLRPQHVLNADGNHFMSGWFGGDHDLKFGGGYRRTENYAATIWPGDMVVGYDWSPTDRRARLYREGAGTDRTEYLSFYAGDTFSRGPLTVDAGVRYDRQWGAALPSNTQANLAFPDRVPGIRFAGYDAPFTWNNVLPRLSATYALDESRRTLLRANVSRYAGQLNTGTVGYSNPSSAVGYVDYRWEDRNGDFFAQPDEILFDEGIVTFGGGFNPADPTAVSSPNLIDPDLTAPVTTSLVFGLDRELAPNLAVQVAYTYTRTSNDTYTTWYGLTPADYGPGPPVTGTLPDGTAYSIPTFIPDAAKIAALGNARILTNYDGYYTAFNGVDMTLIKRMSDRWMARFSGSYNSAREFYDMTPPVGWGGNPTRTDISPLVQGGQMAPRSAGSGAGDVFMNSKWQLNLNGVYELGLGFEAGANLFGRQGTAFPYFQAALLGRDGSNRVLVTPEVDTARFPSLWNLDVRLARPVRVSRLNALLVADLFNVLNSNAELNRIRNIASPNFERITQNLSPRIVRFGIRVGF